MSKMKEVLAAFNKQYGDTTKVITQGVQVKDPSRLPSGLFAFDVCTGGGVPMGRCSVFYGNKDSMKTTVALKLIASAQTLYPDKKAVFVDVEGVFGKKWARTMGVDTDKLVYSQPSNAEQMVDIVEGILYTDDVSIIVVDSLAALISKHEADKSAEEAIVGRTGLVINKFYRRVSLALGDARKNGREPTLVCINQIRFKIGGQGNPETMPGGPSFEYAASLLVRFSGYDKMESAISTRLPAYKEVSLIIKKYKVPILAKKGVMDIALANIPTLSLNKGDAYDWNTLLSYLKSFEFITKAEKPNKGWVLTHPGTGELMPFTRQDDLKTLVYDGSSFGQELKSSLIERMMESDDVLYD